jgi:hypothetical protein
MARQITAQEWGRIIANAWIDPTFSRELSTEPAKAIRSFLGLDPKTEVQVFEPPARPADLSQPQIEDIRNGKATSPFQPLFCC